MALCLRGATGRGSFWDRREEGPRPRDRFSAVTPGPGQRRAPKAAPAGAAARRARPGPAPVPPGGPPPRPPGRPLPRPDSWAARQPPPRRCPHRRAAPRPQPLPRRPHLAGPRPSRAAHASAAGQRFERAPRPLIGCRAPLKHVLPEVRARSADQSSHLLGNGPALRAARKELGAAIAAQGARTLGGRGALGWAWTRKRAAARLSSLGARWAQSVRLTAGLLGAEMAVCPQVNQNHSPFSRISCAKPGDGKCAKCLTWNFFS